MKSKITTDIITTTGFTVDIPPAKIVINNQQITDLETFNKVVNSVKEKNKEIEKLNDIIKNLDIMFEYYFLGNSKYDQDTVNTIYIKYVKLKELKEGK